jgi:hypothetical protein
MNEWLHHIPKPLTFSKGGPSDLLSTRGLATMTPLGFLATSVGSSFRGIECDLAIHPERTSRTQTISSASGKYCRMATRNGAGEVAYETQLDRKLGREGRVDGTESTCMTSSVVTMVSFLCCVTTACSRAIISASDMSDTALRLYEIDC